MYTLRKTIIFCSKWLMVVIFIQIRGQIKLEKLNTHPIQSHWPWYPWNFTYWTILRAKSPNILLDIAPAAKLFIPLQFRTPVRTHLHTANQRPRALICIQPIHRGWFNPRYKLVRPPLLPSAARGAVDKATCSTALHCLFSGCEFKSSYWLFFCYNKMGNNGVYSVRGDTQMMK